MEPWEGESGRFLGACRRRLPSAQPANGYAIDDANSRQGLESLREYLKKNSGAQNLHNRVWMLWASAKIDRLLSASKGIKPSGRFLRSSNRTAASVWAH